MIIYNVTVNLEDSICDEWVQWMKLKHIPNVMETGCFEEYRFTKILTNHGGDGTNYSIQYLCKNMEILSDYQQTHAPKLQKEHIDRYGNKAIAFRTLLELI